MPHRIRIVLDIVFNHFAYDKQLSLEGILIAAIVATADKYLLHRRLCGFNRISQTCVVDRHIAPTNNRLAFLLRDCFDQLDRIGLRINIFRHEKHTHRIVACDW